MLLGTYAIYYTYRLRQTRQYDETFRVHLTMAFVTVVVSKLILTPHAGPGALLALGYQYLVLVIGFTILKPRAAAATTAILIALCTALHKAISWYIIYGGSLIDAIEVWSRWFGTHVQGLSPGPSLLPITYLCLMLTWGVISGWVVLRGHHYLDALATIAGPKKTNKWRFGVTILVVTGAIIYTVRDWTALSRVAVFIVVYLTVILPLWRYLTLEYLLPWLQQRYPDLRPVVDIEQL